MAIVIPPFLIEILLTFGIFLIITVSLNFEVGYAGIPQFGRVLTVLVGAIVAAAIPGRLLVLMAGITVEFRGEEIVPYGAEYANHLVNFRLVDQINTQILGVNPGLSIVMFIVTLILAAIFGAIIGYLTSYPALRLREAYLGITLLAFGDALQLIALNYDPLVGATQGVFVPNFFLWVGATQTSAKIIAILIVAALIYVLVHFWVNSPFGRSLKAMRDSEQAAEVYGKNVPRLRGYTLMIGGALAAIGGALWVIYTGSMDARTFNRLTWTFWPWAFMMLGGTGSHKGMLVGVFFFALFRYLIFAYKGVLEPFIPISIQWLEYILIGLIIVLVSMFRPQGLLPEKPRTLLPKERVEELAKASA